MRLRDLSIAKLLLASSPDLIEPGTYTGTCGSTYNSIISCSFTSAACTNTTGTTIIIAAETYKIYECIIDLGTIAKIKVFKVQCEIVQRVKE